MEVGGERGGEVHAAPGPARPSALLPSPHTGSRACGAWAVPRGTAVWPHVSGRFPHLLVPKPFLCIVFQDPLAWRIQSQVRVAGVSYTHGTMG